MNAARSNCRAKMRRRASGVGVLLGNFKKIPKGALQR